MSIGDVLSTMVESVFGDQSTTSGCFCLHGPATAIDDVISMVKGPHGNRQSTTSEVTGGVQQAAHVSKTAVRRTTSLQFCDGGHWWATSGAPWLLFQVTLTGGYDRR